MSYEIKRKNKMENSKLVIVLTESTMNQPLKYGFSKYQTKYSYLKEGKKIEVEMFVQSLSIFKVFKWINKKIFAELGSLEGAKVNVIKIKK